MADSAAMRMIEQGTNPFGNVDTINDLIDAVLGCGAAMVANYVGGEEIQITAYSAIVTDEAELAADLAKARAAEILAE